MVSIGVIVVGVAMTFFGLGAAWNAEEVARKDEQYDAIGSQRDAVDAKPADWKVKTTRWLWGAVGIAGIATTVFGFVQ